MYNIMLDIQFIACGVLQERKFWNIGVGNDTKEINFLTNDFLIILMKNGEIQIMNKFFSY